MMTRVLNVRGLLFRGSEKEWGIKTLLRRVLNIATILHWSLKPILHSLEQWTSRLRLPSSHQGDIIYIMRRCHGNKAPISTGVVSHGGWVPRCLPNMQLLMRCRLQRCERRHTCTHTNIRSEPERERVRMERHTWLENKGWEGNCKWASSGVGGVCWVFVSYLCFGVSSMLVCLTAFGH